VFADRRPIVHSRKPWNARLHDRRFVAAEGEQMSNGSSREALALQKPGRTARRPPCAWGTRAEGRREQREQREAKSERDRRGGEGARRPEERAMTPARAFVDRGGGALDRSLDDDGMKTRPTKA